MNSSNTYWTEDSLPRIERKPRRSELRWPARAAIVLSLVLHALLILYSPEVHLMQPVPYMGRQTRMSVRPDTIPQAVPAPGLATHAEGLAPERADQILQTSPQTEQELAMLLSRYGEATSDPLSVMDKDAVPSLPEQMTETLPDVPPVMTMDESVLPEDAEWVDLLPTAPSSDLRENAALYEDPSALLDSTIAGFSGTGAGEMAQSLAGLAAGSDILETGMPDEPLPLPDMPDMPGLALSTELPSLPAAEGPAPEPIDEFVDIELRSFQGNDPYIYFELQILNPPDRPLAALPRAVWFVVDSSRSMGEANVLMTAEGIYQCMNAIQPGTLWNIVQFKGSPRFFQLQPVSAIDAEERKRAILFLNDMHASGQTDVFRSLQIIVESIGGRPARPVQVFLISDGRPTSGVRDSREIIDQISRFNQTGISIFTLGIGRNANRELISYLAYWNRGAASINVPNRQIPEALEQMVMAYRRPVLHRPRYQLIGAGREIVLPSVLPDLYEGIPLVLYGRVPRNQQPFAMHLVGEGASGPRDLLVPLDPGGAQPGDAGIRRAWAESYLRELRGRKARGDSPEAMEALIQETASLYQLPVPE